MKLKLPLGEKLRDLRTAKKYKLADAEAVANLSTSMLQHVEADEDIRI